ncbi:MAG TPA: carbohydrate ABC transporter permease [Magnetospirillaceae bacterium]|jgi:raffinose/stachyose/melibiose transport system permease protein
MAKARRNIKAEIAAHAILILYTIIALAPVILVTMNSLKSKAGIFGEPLVPPTPDTFSVVGYHTVFLRGDFALYFENSLIVTIVSLALIVIFGAMAGFALSEYRFKMNRLVGLYMAIGIMIPIRLGTVAILKIMVGLDLANTLLALILVYTAQGLPLAIYVLSEFMRQVSDDLKNAARIDGLSEYTILFRLVMPVIRPAIATITVFTMVPIWNDLWFPLVLAPGAGTKTVTLGAQSFIGQFVVDWNALLAALTLAIVPVVILYILFSRQLMRGLTAGAVK